MQAHKQVQSYFLISFFFKLLLQTFIDVYDEEMSKYVCRVLIHLMNSNIWLLNDIAISERI